jgi:hypothetical protein
MNAPQPPQLLNVSLSDAYERGKTDINFFAALCMPEVFLYKLPLFYIAAWQLISSDAPDRIDSLFRFALGLPRGHAKTTFVKILIAWMICYDKASFILVVCSNSGLAENLLADIDDILASDNITSIYGIWDSSNKAIDSKDTKKAAYHGRSVTLVARGWSAGIRGINLKNQRPDFIFCDDAQTKDNDESQLRERKLMRELVGTIFKAVSHRGSRTIVYVGNLYSDECILQQFRKNKHWTSLVTGAILEDGSPLWPELVSLKELKESYEHDEALGLSHIWFAEVMNDPQSVLHSLLPKPLPDSDVEEILLDDGAYITIDPAGFREESDDNVITGFKKYNDRGYAVAMNRDLDDPAEIVKEAINMALRIGASLIGVESVGYQQTLGFWINFFLKKLHISHITVVELHPHGRSKEARIRQYVKELYAGTQVIHDPKCRREFTWQGAMYKLGKKKNKDDVLDGFAYSLDIRNEFWDRIVPLNGHIQLVDHNKCSVEHNGCF